MVALPDRLIMTYEEYLAWESTQEMRHEFWDGEVIAIAGGTRDHNRVSVNFLKVLDNALADLSCEVYIAGVKVQIQPKRKYFYPDVVVTCDERDRNDALVVAYPCLIIEVLSPSTEAFESLSETLRERGFKFSQYRKFETLQEYVLVQVDQPIVEVFQRNDQRQWVFFEYGLSDHLFLKSVNLEIAISDLYRQIQFEQKNE
ncbi:Uma2 family endonuclease [Pseudanabaena sp. UWO311]|uniref:Uma2 family endonuclease n=1 Tax=Pseudanabaena sp. UWO311 TaxID=2487337 RepID=UPI00115797C1|nr:Uma2 family endonuclease [Pseudanabaena sp. UWO311]TYQ24121.1 Uma2 family endonuclease [Pseudanabaena sp. UWO311]